MRKMCIIIHLRPMPEKIITEDFLHYVWLTKSFDQTNLATVEGLPLKILTFGHHNPSDGPDFLDARIQVGDVVWSGSVEIHINSSDWDRHGHSPDKNYKNTILHVVYRHDRHIRINDTEEVLPCLEVGPRISENQIKLLHSFDHNKWIPCESLISEASDISIFSTKERSLSSRMVRRWKEVNILNEETNYDWEEFGYRLLCRAFGLVHNSEAFLAIAKTLPLKVLKKNSHSLLSVEALLYGASGILDQSFKDDYPNRLKNEYDFLKKKYSINSGSLISLKHKAVRPQNFPEISLSQFANLITKDGIISKLLDQDQKGLFALLKVSTSEYWNNHYTFDQLSKTKKKTLGVSRIRIIIINAIVPTLYYLGKKYSDEDRIKKAISLLEEMPTEKNSIITRWQKLGLTTKSAYDSQALLELKKHHCDLQKCMSCPIGHNILKKAH